jgi:hypothetical protein
MNIRSLFFSASLLAFTTSLYGQSQCAQPQSQQITCHSNSCNEIITITVPQSAQYGLNFGKVGAECCGYVVYSYQPIGGSCNTTIVRTSPAIAELRELFKTHSFLVANCDGNYRVFDSSVPVAQTEIRQRTNLLDGKISLPSN